MENSLATVGDVGLVIHDWIFTEAHFAASLYLPIALDHIGAKEGFQSELEKQNKRAKCWIIVY